MQDVVKRLDAVEKLAHASKTTRFLSRPIRYSLTLLFNKILYPFTKTSIIRRAHTFFGKDMFVALPAGTDIYLTDGKSHVSETNLARLMLEQLKPGDIMIDVGAHFGYFSLLAASIVGETGQVVAIEASNRNFKMLQINTAPEKNIRILHNAVSNEAGELTFYEFPELYSEYNSMDIKQFDDLAWIKKYRPEKVTVQAITLDELILALPKKPAIIKIDVEGAEYLVAQGMQHFLQENSTGLIVMEYLSPKRHSTAHQKAKTLIEGFGYISCIVHRDGALTPVQNIDQYMEDEQLDSDNIVFKKR